ncbi:toll-like receptor 3 [Bicyclus anynana]|uniref:Toll-like receptor 3 n=1 Tax=Bicyclus anynana TaxID=110368 RepID=A0A6J1P221_BICAN|nr:toll-like receptor 3 [Bicyclus anynana]
MLLLFLMVFATIDGIKGDCSFVEYSGPICTAKITCVGTTEDIDTLLNNWRCIKSDSRQWNRYTETYDYELNDYKLDVDVQFVNVDDNENPLIGIEEDTKVATLNIGSGNLVSVPPIISRLIVLTEFSLTYNQVEMINLRKLSGVSMKVVNVSHNQISTIEEDENVNPYHSLVSSIDLSYNALESIPDNCFEMFSTLIYLDLSFNKLKQFDILTFEGITQLETLKLSNNEISEISQNLARFRHLKDLAIDNNQLTSLTAISFKSLISLQKLNLSSNYIKHIEDESLATLRNLKELDLSHNKINAIRQHLFQNNNKMFKLSLSHNDIENIAGGAFSTTNISFFDIQDNHIRGSIDSDTFLGISVESLDLSKGGGLKALGDKAFSTLGQNLKYLNLSNNLLENITESAFQSLEILRILDLSCNNLVDIEFNTSDLTQLTEYYIQNNLIKKVNSKMFKNMKSLVRLDLSNNKVEDIEFSSFIDLTNLRDLNISNNAFVNSLTQNLFRGLYKVNSLDLSYIKSVSCLNGTFSGMASLVYLNLSHSLFDNIEYETFKATGSIKSLDVSHNFLQNFHINTSSILQILELYLNNNKLQNITSETFKNLRFLEKLNLAYNNIYHFDSRGLQSTPHLHYLDMFSNYNLHVMGDVFNNLILSKVSLRNVRHKFNFEKAANTSISTLILSNCDIDDINSVYVYQIKDILKLDASSNKIKVLNKGSLQNMNILNWLDLSFNIISTIQPGTFLSNEMINSLNLYSNNLQYLQFGVLDGLRNLRILNLSNNEIHTFGVNLLHSSPYLNELFLDNNNLKSMDFTALSETSVNIITIGGNSISCDALAYWKKYNNYNLNVTAETFDFDSENIHGIACKTNSSRVENKYENNNFNITSDVNEIKKAVDNIYNYLKMPLNETFSRITALLENNHKYFDNALAKLNRSEIVFDEQFRKNAVNSKSDLLPQLLNNSDRVANNINTMIRLLEINNNLTKLGNIQKDKLQSPVLIANNMTIGKYVNNNSTGSATKLSADSLNEFDNNTLVDIKILLYIIASCFTIAILLFVVTITYKYWYRQVSHRVHVNQLYDSGQSVRGGLEME